jgi:hypothetical protein
MSGKGSTPMGPAAAANRREAQQSFPASIKPGPIKPAQLPNVLADNRKIMDATAAPENTYNKIHVRQLWENRHDPNVHAFFENGPPGKPQLGYGKGTALPLLQDMARRRGVNLEAEAAELKKKPKRVSMSPRGPDGARSFTVD